LSDLYCHEVRRRPVGLSVNVTRSKMKKVQGTADDLLLWSHFLTPKKAGPDHLVPVITNAIFEREEYLSPR